MFRAGSWDDIPLPDQVAGPTVYHYTNAAGLLGMFRTRSFWASSPLALNDMSEIDYGLQLVREGWRDWPKHQLTELSEFDRGLMAAALEPDQFNYLKDGVYLLSASLEGDSLNQWQGYSGRQGYCLGIDSTERLTILAPGSSEGPSQWLDVVAGPLAWYRVVYDSKEQKDCVQRMLAFLLAFLPGENERGEEPPDIQRFFSTVRTCIGMLAPLLKHSAFSDEREVRLVATPTPLFPERFREGRFGIVPYVELVAAKASDYNYACRGELLPLPLSQLICGPADVSQRPAVLAAAKRLQASFGYRIDVKASEIPYRF